MFDIGFSELILIGIVALVVVGPERLPRVARTAGLLFGRLQRHVNEVKAEISREIQLDELKKLQHEVQESARHLERSLTDGLQDFRQEALETADAIKADVEASLDVNAPALPREETSSGKD